LQVPARFTPKLRRSSFPLGKSTHWTNTPYGLTKPSGEQLVQLYGRAGRMEAVILRFSHTQEASELLDEDSFSSGPRFYLRSRIRQQEALGNHEMAEFLRCHDPGEPAHIVLCSEQGGPYRVHITDTRDMVSGILLAVLSCITGYPVVKVDLRGAIICNRISNG